MINQCQNIYQVFLPLLTHFQFVPCHPCLALETSTGYKSLLYRLKHLIGGRFQGYTKGKDHIKLHLSESGFGSVAPNSSNNSSISLCEFSLAWLSGQIFSFLPCSPLLHLVPAPAFSSALTTSTFLFSTFFHLWLWSWWTPPCWEDIGRYPGGQTGRQTAMQSRCSHQPRSPSPSCSLSAP